MGWFKREPSLHEKELIRIQEKLKELEIASDEYDKTLKEMMSVQTFCEKEKDRRQLLTKEGRGSILGKIVGFVGLGGIAWGVMRFEKSGQMFSGQSNGLIASVLKIGTKFFG